MTLRVGIVGAGNMANVHVEGWTAAADDVVAIYAPHKDRAQQLADMCGAIAVDTVEDLLESCDVVDICTPTDTHLDYVQRAAAVGIPIVCEKPLGRTAAEARAAVDASEAAGVPLLVAHVVRFFGDYATARGRVVAGDVGDVAVVRLDRSTYLPAGASAWFRDSDRSGGVVLDLMIHDVDYARWVAGPVVRAYARMAQGPGGAGHVLATLRHADGGISHIQGSWAFPTGSFRTSFEIAGSDGLIGRIPSEPVRSIVAPNPDVPDVPTPPITGESPYVAQMKHFSDVLQGKASPRITPIEAVAAVAVCDAIAESIETGRAITVEEAP
ncbi:MAG: Gfo/Idh/MocA family oxidoreductase [Actinomycetota bacterium]